jgi:hypothetical protein
MKQQDKVVSYKDMQVAIFRFAACSRFHARLGTRSRPSRCTRCRLHSALASP